MADDPQNWASVVDKTSGRTYWYNKVTKATSWTAPQGWVDPKTRKSVGDVWKEVIDKTSGKSYYYNRQTKETRWDAPEHYIPAKEKLAAAAAAGAGTSTGASAATVAGASSGAGATSGAGAASKEKEITKTSPAPAVASTSANDPFADWKETVDKTSGKKYYYNKKTKETSWEDPRKKAAATSSSATVNLKAQATSAPVAAAASTAPAAAVASSGPGAVAADSSSQKSAKALFADDEEVKIKQTTTAATTDEPKSDYQMASSTVDSMAALKRQQSQGRRNVKDIMAEDDSGDDGDEDFDFLFAKHRHGLVNRVLRTGAVLDNQKLMSFKKSMIKKALLKQNRDLDEKCVQTFKNIMSYMRDRQSTKPPPEHAQKLLRYVMDSPAGLRDEVYLQICKQVTGNPSEEHTLYGWELMLICLATFPPSKPLRKFLNAFLQENIAGKEHSGDTQAKIAEYAKIALENVPRIMALGQRKEVMSTGELSSCKQMKGMSIRVFLIDGTFKTIIVNSYTMTADVIAIVNNKLNLTCTSPFALYEVTKDTRLMQPKELVLDCVARWENNQKDGDKKEKEEATTYHFLYKAKLVLKADHPEVMADGEAVNLLYLQSVNDVTKARYVVKDNHLCILAALQLQATFGDFQEDMHGNGWILDKLEQFIPTHLLTDKKPEKEKALKKQWEQNILAKYEKVRGFTTLEAKFNYLDYVHEWPVYGVTYFVVQQRQFKDYPSPILLGVTCEGTLLVHPGDKSILDNYRYSDIVTWGHSDDKFILVVGNVVQQRKLVFKTPEGAIINQLVHDYVKTKVELQKPAGAV